MRSRPQARALRQLGLIAAGTDFEWPAGSKEAALLPAGAAPFLAARLRRGEELFAES